MIGVWYGLCDLGIQDMAFVLVTVSFGISGTRAIPQPLGNVVRSSTERHRSILPSTFNYSV
jgi:hypothetical protein